nr:hypothetical protein [Ktedonosporobacter rubrisoli]
MRPKVPIRCAGLRLAHWKGLPKSSPVIVCGLAGALSSHLAPGTVLIPERVGLTDGSIRCCDPMLVQILVAAAQMLHLRLDTGTLLTAQSLIVGQERHVWYQRGFVAADMETGLLLDHGLRIASIRVILDNPEHDISLDWLHPLKVLLRPSLREEFFWLSHMAPRYALRAARVLKVGLDLAPDSIFV